MDRTGRADTGGGLVTTTVARIPDALHLPDDFLAKLAVYIQRGPTGSIVLHVKEGKVMSWELKETGRLT